MGDQVLILVTAILIAVSAIGLAYSVRRLRRETILNTRTWLLGAGVPVVATLAYLLLGGPPFHFLVVLVVFAMGLAITTLVGAARSGSGGPPGGVRQTGVTLAIWAVIYVLAALTAFIPRADSQALMAVLLALCAGLAAGTQVGLALRARQRAVPAPAVATAGGPPFAWQAAVQPQAVIAPAPYAAPPPASIAAPPAPAPVAPSAPAPPSLPATTPPAQPPTPAPVAPALVAPPAPAGPPTSAAPPASVAATPVAPPAPTPVAPAAPAPTPAAMPAEPIHFSHIGQRFLFGYTPTVFGIWDLANRQGAQVQYPRSPEGRIAAWSQFITWEGAAVPVMPYPGLPLGPIADAPVSFSHVGPRFAVGHTATEHGIWDRWAPGPPVARFGVDPQGAALAWQTFIAWEPGLMQL